MSQTELLELKASPKEFFEKLRKGGKMCAVMGDFTVPSAIHKKTWDYPLMPEKASIPEDQLSPKQVELNVNNNRTKHSSHQQYLLQTMWDKHHYFVYGELLDFYLQQGIEMTHLYCGIVFNVKECVAEAICGHEHTTQEPLQERRASHRHHCVQTSS